jgi:hypothetical protein
MSTMTVSQPPKCSDRQSFVNAARAVMREVQESLERLVAGIPRAQISKAADLQKALDLDPKLGWRIFRIATADSALAAGTDVPSAVSMRRLFKSAAKQGVPEKTIERASEAFERFEALVAEHASDRATFSTMISNVAGGSSESIDLRARREAFRLNSQIWGVQVKTILACTLHRPGKRPQVIDSVSVRGSRDIRCLREGASLRIAGHQAKDAGEALQRVTELEESNGLSSQDFGLPPGTTLLTDFCTSPIPKLVHRVENAGFIATYLQDAPLGNAGKQTLYLADMTRDIAWVRPEGPPNDCHFNATIRKPAEVLVFDTLFLRGMFGELAPDVKVYASLDRPGIWDPKQLRADETLPMSVDVQRVGIGLDVLPTPHVPRYAEMVESVCRRVGWDAEEFEVFRCIVEYPVLGSIVSARFELPEKGNW